MKDIPGFEGIYQIDECGNVYSTRRYRNLTPVKKDGYIRFMLSSNGSVKSYYAHRLVAITFIPNPSNKPDVNHINGIKNDNRVINLEWVTESENLIHACHVLKIPTRIKSKMCLDLRTGIFYSSAREALKARGMNYDSSKIRSGLHDLIYC